MFSGDRALELLKQLDSRQEQILKDIDDLNSRIEALLDSFQATRSGRDAQSIPLYNGSVNHENSNKPDVKKAA